MVPYLSTILVNYLTIRHWLPIPLLPTTVTYEKPSVLTVSSSVALPDSA
jgi:hypothetical protein